MGFIPRTQLLDEMSIALGHNYNSNHAVNKIDEYNMPVMLEWQNQCDTLSCMVAIT